MAQRHRWLALALATASLCLPSAEAHADPTERCLSAYEKAQRLRQKKQLLAARSELVVCAQQSCPSELARDCSTWLSEVDTATPTLVVEVVKDGVRLTEATVIVDAVTVASRLDGVAVPLDPGEHEVVVVLPGGERKARNVVLLEGEKARRLSIDLETPRAAEPDYTPAYAFAAGSVAALGSFTFFALRSHDKHAELESCKGHCPSDAVSEVRREQLAADISLGVALLAAGAATYFFLRPAPGAELGFRAAPGGGGVALGVEL